MESSSLVRRVLASLELRRDHSTDYRAAFSSVKGRSTTDRVALSLDSVFFCFAIKVACLGTSRSQEKNHMLEAVKKERVPSRSTS
jgi:hypothetical protein